MEDLVFTCCICDKTVQGYGNNPEPINHSNHLNNDDARCCDDCNNMYVVPARMLQLLG